MRRSLQSNKNGSLAARSPLSASVEYSSRSVVSEQRQRTISEYSSRPITPLVTETRTVIQKEEWLEAARRSTENFRRYGSPLPLIWVLTEGKNIPEGAVPFGEDRYGCTMYIARALLEGGLHIGKAGPQFEGAVIGYAGKEHLIPHYEVLVCASQVRWGFSPPSSDGLLAQGTVILAQQRAQKTTNRSRFQQTEVDIINTTLVESDIVRFIADEVNVQPYREVELKRLAEIKTVIVIDDSMSMQEGNLWEQTREALGGIIDIANQYGSKGSDIHFMHDSQFSERMQSKAAVNTLFNENRPEGEDTPTGAKLGEIIEFYLPLIEDERANHEPITVVVITDGLPTDQELLETVIVDAAHRLDRNRVKHDMFGIQFVQIGTDPAASDLLHKLDDHLVSRYNIRDLVDSTPFDPAQGAFDTEYMLKILLGGLHKDLDRTGPSSGTLLSAPTPRTLDRSPRGGPSRLAGITTRTLTPRP